MFKSDLAVLLFSVACVFALFFCWAINDDDDDDDDELVSRPLAARDTRADIDGQLHGLLPIPMSTTFYFF